MNNNRVWWKLNLLFNLNVDWTKIKPIYDKKYNDGQTLNIKKAGEQALKRFYFNLSLYHTCELNVALGTLKHGNLCFG